MKARGLPSPREGGAGGGVVRPGRRVGHLAEWAAAPLVALGFLTVLPVPQPGRPAVALSGAAVACFPLVGAALGGSLGVLGRPLEWWFPPGVVAGLLLALLLALTGALHLDGLMDSFDGLFGGRDPAGRLAIMKDSRVGSYGIAAAVGLLLLEYGSLASLSGDARLSALLVAVTLSRWAMALALRAFPAASSTGLASGLRPELRWWHMAIATTSALGIAVVGLGWLAAVMAAATVALVLLGGRWVVARIGGVTGDICGGLGQLVEALVLVTCTSGLASAA